MLLSLFNAIKVFCSFQLYTLLSRSIFYSFEPLVLGFFKSSLGSYKIFTQLVIQALYPSGIIMTQCVHTMIWVLAFSIFAGEFCIEPCARDTFLLQHWRNFKGQELLTPSSACVWSKHVSLWTGVYAVLEQWD